MQNNLIYPMLQQLSTTSTTTITVLKKFEKCEYIILQQGVDIDTYKLIVAHYEIFDRLCTPEFTQKLIGKQIRKKAELHTIAAIKTLGVEYVEVSFISSDKSVVLNTLSGITNKWVQQAQVVVHANIRYVEETGEWYYNICMECNERIKMENGAFICETYKRRIPHPEKK